MRVTVVKPADAAPAGAFRISLCDRNRDVAGALASAFANVNEVEVCQGDILDLTCDSVLSPANSFGDMDGGFDKALDDHYGGAAQVDVKRAIADRCFGELPVGHALVVPMGTARFPYLVCAPTMRVPGNVAGTINAYLAFRAALVAVLLFDRSGQGPIRSIASPGLCTGVGGMAYGESARQMRTAYESVVRGGWRKVVYSALAPFALHDDRALRPPKPS